MDNKKLYVGNLPWTTTDEQLKEAFLQFGEIVEAVVIRDKMSGRSKGFGFITFADEEAAKKAISEMHQKEFGGRNIVVNMAKPKKERNNGFSQDSAGDF